MPAAQVPTWAGVGATAPNGRYGISLGERDDSVLPPLGGDSAAGRGAAHRSRHRGFAADGRAIAKRDAAQGHEHEPTAVLALMLIQRPIRGVEGKRVVGIFQIDLKGDPEHAQAFAVAVGVCRHEHRRVARRARDLGWQIRERLLVTHGMDEPPCRLLLTARRFRHFVDHRPKGQPKRLGARWWRGRLGRGGEHARQPARAVERILFLCLCLCLWCDTRSDTGIDTGIRPARERVSPAPARRASVWHCKKPCVTTGRCNHRRAAWRASRRTTTRRPRR